MNTFLLLHGFTGAPKCFDAIAARLPRSARVIAPLIAGHGPAPTPVGSWDEEVARLESVLVKARARNVHVVGYSLGGRLGWSLAARSPRVSRATLIGAHPGLRTEREREERRGADARWISMLRGEGLEAFADAWQALPMWKTQRALPAETQKRRRAIRMWHTAPGLADALERLGLAEMPTPERSDKPLHLVVGSGDRAHRELSSRALARYPGARRTLVSGAGHDVLLEREDSVLALLGLAPGRRAS